jgi:hypothetical protein
MKTSHFLAVGVAWLLLPGGIHAQGTVNFTTRIIAFGIDAPVTVCTLGAVRLAGIGYLATLYWGRTSDSLQPVMDFRDDVATYLAKPFRQETGYVTAGKVTIVGVCEGSQVYIQMRAWEGGEGSTYESVRAFGHPVGESNTIRVTLGGDLILAVPTALIGLQPFTIRAPDCVPEPPPLLGLGPILVALPFLRRWGQTVTPESG